MDSQSQYLKSMQEAALRKVVDDLVREKDDGWKNRTSRDSYTSKLQCLELMGIDITRDALYKRVERQSKSKKQLKSTSTPIEVVAFNQPHSEVSSLSSPSTESNTPESIPGRNHLLEDMVTLPKAGRPKGSTDQKKRADIKNFNQCINAITDSYKTELTLRRGENKRVQKGYLEQVIQEKKEEFGVSCAISNETVRSRIKRGILGPTHRGTAAPLQNAELALVEIIIQMGKIRQPLTRDEAIGIMNDMISETEMSETLKEFQKVRTSSSLNFGSVGKNWWQGFKKRHASALVSKRGEKFALNRADWTKLSNIKQMYEYIYDEMLTANIASPREHPVYTDREGNEVQESERFGLAQSISIDHPDYILFADESGCQTNQKQDGKVANRKYIVEHGTVPQVICNTSDHRFTILPFTSGSGEAVCCVLIFQHKEDEIPMTWKTGIDITVENPLRNEKGEIDLEMNIGESKYYPEGPKCKYRGKEVRCLTFASDSGGITGAILVKVLEYFDEIDLFPRYPGGPIPMLIVDGHQSRLDPKFVAYINNKAHEWRVCLGVPYATVLWQVGDASEQNGKFKIEWTKVKEWMMVWKSINCLPLTIGPTDIIPLVNRIFHKSYGSINSNLKALADRGWNPPNRKLLEHKELIDDSIAPINENTLTDASSSSSPNSPVLNIHQGLAATVLDRMIAERARSSQAKRAADERKRKGDSILQNLKESKKLTSGVMASNGIHSLSDPRFLQAYHDRRSEAREKLERNVVARKANTAKKIEGVKKLREKFGHESTHMFAQFSKEECSTYLQYKKQSNKDPGRPKDLQERRARCIEWMTRQSPTASPAASDDEGDDPMKDGMTEEEADGETRWDVMDCVDGLMEFANQAGGGGDGTIGTCAI